MIIAQKIVQELFLT